MVANISKSGLWTVNVTTTQSGLLNPIAIELYQGELETTSTTTSTETTTETTTTSGITTSTETTTETTTTSGESSTTEPTIGMGSVYSLGVLVIMALGLARKRKK